MAVFDPTGLTLPDFYIIGAMKSGTSALRTMLISHEDVSMPGNGAGEMHWFDKEVNWRRGLRPYSDKFAEKKKEGKLVGDKTPRYLNTPESLLRLHHTTPDAKLIILLRCPTTRWFSHHNHKRKEMSHQSFFDLHQGAIGRGMYLGHLENVFSLFSSKQVHIEFTERMRDHTRERVGLVFDFLAIDKRKSWKIRKSSRRWEDNAVWRDRLNEIYRPMIPSLKEFLHNRFYNTGPVDGWCASPDLAEVGAALEAARGP